MIYIRNMKMLAAAVAIAASVLLNASAASAAFRIERDIVFDRHDGADLRGDLYIPEGKGPFPAILFFHGGGFVGGAKNNDIQHKIYAYYAERGYAVFTAEYRLLRAGGVFPNNVKDGKCALAWLKKNGAKYNIDVRRVGVMGESAGGYMAAMVALAPNDDYFSPSCGSTKGVDMSINAGVLYYAPFNFATLKAGFVQVMEIELRRALGLKTKKATEEYKLRNSPISYVSNAMPIMLFNTEKDTTVDPAQSDEMAAALEKAGKVVVHIIEKGEGMEHGFAIVKFDSPQAEDARKRGLEFFDKYMKQ